MRAARHRPPPGAGLPAWLAAALLLAGVMAELPCRAQVALLGGATARPLRGQFNTVPVLHSNQPEEVEGPGILVDTRPGAALAVETGEPLANATYRFNGAFGLHLHHKYAAAPGERFLAAGRRRELFMAAVLFNPGTRPVRIRFESGAVRNSFEAPYLGDNLMGVKPLGPRPWNTGPGDATAVQLLRGRLDPRLSEEVVIPGGDRIVLFSTKLPALGVANALLKGSSDGPFEMAVVAAEPPGDPQTVLATLDAGRLAPGRVYLNQLEAIRTRAVFARVAGVALGDAYSASISHDLDQAGPLHVPLTSTDRTDFGSGDVQVNPLLSRMVDSSLDNVGTYGVRFDLDLHLRGQGPYALMLSHPSDSRGRVYTAFRGSIAIRTPAGQQDVHVGMRSGESLQLASLMLQPGRAENVQISLVYPADATPGHLLSVISESQLAQFREQERLLVLQRQKAAPRPPNPPPPLEPPPPLAAVSRPGSGRSAASGSRASLQRQPKRAAPANLASGTKMPWRGAGQPLRPPRDLGTTQATPPLRPPVSLRRDGSASASGPSSVPVLVPLPLRPATMAGGRSEESGDTTLADRYRQAVEAQERIIRSWSSP